VRYETPPPEGSPTQRSSALRGVSHVFPDLQEDLLLNLFHKGAKSQWTAPDLDWDLPADMTLQQQQALARLLSPILLGEQTAMVGASAIIPRLLEAGETTAQLYLTSFMMDEARHVEVLARLYRRVGQDPMRIRDLPEMLRYHHRLRQGDRVDWVWGILVSDLFGKHFYRSFVEARWPALVGQIASRILQDESRHLAFAEHYLRRNVPHFDPARRRALVNTRDELYQLIATLLDRLRADCETLGFDGALALERLWTELDVIGRRIGLGDGDPPIDGAPAGESTGAEESATSREVGRTYFTAPLSLPRCFGCLLSSLCQPRPALA
jgi:para-aminobenzoate N-oxygenase AurF